MKIIAIDPGNTQSAWCELIEGKPAASSKDLNHAVLARLRNEGSPAADLLAIEMIASYGMAVGREVFDTCLWVGRFLEAWASRGGAVQLVYRREVKLFHCGSARATDSNIRAALIDRYGPGRELAVGTKRAPGPLYGLKGDTWSAFAVALTAEATKRPTLGALERVATTAKPAHEKEGVPF
jgi:hypothetical protein